MINTFEKNKKNKGFLIKRLQVAYLQTNKILNASIWNLLLVIYRINPKSNFSYEIT